MSRRDLRTVPRYFLDPPFEATADSHPVRLVDLSVKGARLEIHRPLEPGREIVLRLDWRGTEMAIGARVLWCDIDSLAMVGEEDGYLTGVAFAHVSAAIDEMIEDLCDTGQAVRIEDARQHDRYCVTVPLTGSFAGIAPVSVVDLSVAGACIRTAARIAPGMSGALRFQVDGKHGPTEVIGTAMWVTPAVGGGVHAGLHVAGADERLRDAIHRLCLRGEARVDVESLRRKFDRLRAERAGQLVAG